MEASIKDNIMKTLINDEDFNELFNELKKLYKENFVAWNLMTNRKKSLELNDIYTFVPEFIDLMVKWDCFSENSMVKGSKQLLYLCVVLCYIAKSITKEFTDIKLLDYYNKKTLHPYPIFIEADKKPSVLLCFRLYKKTMGIRLSPTAVGLATGDIFTKAILQVYQDSNTIGNVEESIDLQNITINEIIRNFIDVSYNAE